MYTVIQLIVGLFKSIKGYTVYFLVNTILRITLYLQMLYRQLVDRQTAPPILLSSGAKSPLTKAFVQLAPFFDQTNTIQGKGSYTLASVQWAMSIHNTEHIAQIT